jgi:hypothetical protein
MHFVAYCAKSCGLQFGTNISGDYHYYVLNIFKTLNSRIFFKQFLKRMYSKNFNICFMKIKQVHGRRDIPTGSNLRTTIWPEKPTDTFYRTTRAISTGISISPMVHAVLY